MYDSTNGLISLNEITDTGLIKGVRVPGAVKFRQIIVTGPPCSGKSVLVGKLGGWPEEGYVDLARKNWWQSRIFTFRPREVHFGFPFVGFEESHAVFDREWLQAPADMDRTQIKLPPKKRWFFSMDWRSRYAFDFQLPPAEQIHSILEERGKRGTHLKDAELNLQRIQQAVKVYAELALFFHENGLLVYVRDSFDGDPKVITAT